MVFKKRGVDTMITWHEGDILESGADYILHQVNCMGVMGAGLAKQIKTKWPEVYEEYYKCCEENASKRTKLLGDFVVANTSTKAKSGHPITVINLFGQYGYGGGCQTDYHALERALGSFIGVFDEVYKELGTIQIQTIAIPYKLGCGLAGGDWNVVYDIIKRHDTDWADIQIWKLPIEQPSFKKRI